MEDNNGRFLTKKVNFSQVSNTALRDDRLSLKAKGLYSLIQSYITIENFVLYKNTLRGKCKEGDTSFNNTWKELKQHGYLVQHKNRNEKGNWFYTYELLDYPEVENRGVEKSPSGRVGVYNNTDSNNTDLNNTYINNNSLQQDKYIEEDIQDIQQDTTTITTDNLVDKTVINNSKDFINYFCNKYYSVYSTKYIPNYSREGGMVKNKLLKQFNSDTLVAIIDTFIDNYSAKWARKQYPYPTIGALCSWAVNDCLSMINNSMNKNTKTVNNYALKKIKEDSSNFLGL